MILIFHSISCKNSFAQNEGYILYVNDVKGKDTAQITEWISDTMEVYFKNNSLKIHFSKNKIFGIPFDFLVVPEQLSSYFIFDDDKTALKINSKGIKTNSAKYQITDIGVKRKIINRDCKKYKVISSLIDTSYLFYVWSDSLFTIPTLDNPDFIPFFSLRIDGVKGTPLKMQCKSKDSESQFTIETTATMLRLMPLEKTLFTIPKNYAIKEYKVE